MAELQHMAHNALTVCFSRQPSQRVCNVHVSGIARFVSMKHEEVAVPRARSDGYARVLTQKFANCSRFGGGVSDRQNP